MIGTEKILKIGTTDFARKEFGLMAYFDYFCIGECFIY